MTNTLENRVGWVHIRPDWDDARHKVVSIVRRSGRPRRSPCRHRPHHRRGRQQRGRGKDQTALPVLREMRVKLSEFGKQD